jgi:hypothetical protein
MWDARTMLKEEKMSALLGFEPMALIYNAVDSNFILLGYS